MKRFLILLFVLVASLQVQAQFFNNSNGELCKYLYEKQDGRGVPYMVYMVMEDLSEEDIAVLNQWDTLDEKTRSIVTQRWSVEGKRIEVQSSPYVTYPPVFPKDLKQTKLVKVAPADNKNDTLWTIPHPIKQK